jgi:hypothetical protein
VPRLQKALENVQKRIVYLSEEGGVLHQAAQLTEPVVPLDQAQTALETLLDTAGLALGAARHGTPVPPEVQSFEDLAERLEAAMERYVAEAEKVKSEALAKRSVPAPQATQPVTVSSDKEIVQHTEAGGLVDQVAGVVSCRRWQRPLPPAEFACIDFESVFLPHYSSFETCKV